ncbi:MAG TPA: diguanylate cyclase, partial [Mariprofundaceae bacterium]|nr:diguanylate cyclase [Mariprofundaceae bacterium]
MEAQATPSLHLDASEPFHHLDEHIEYLEDPSGKLDIASVRKQQGAAWKINSKDSPSFGFSESAYWFRANLETSERHTWLLEIDSPLLDRISLYLFSEDNLVQEVQTGDTMPFAERPLPFREFILPLNLPPKGQATLYLRVKSEGSLEVPMNLWLDSSFFQQDEMETAALGLYFGAILIMALYNLFLYLRVHEPAYIYYVLYVIAFGFFVIGLVGWGYKYLWPESPGFQQYNLGISITLGGIFVCRFIHHFLDLPSLAPRLAYLLAGAAFIQFSLLCLLPFVPYNTIVQAALAITILIAMMAQYSGIMLWHRNIDARYFTVAWSAFLLAVIMAILEKFSAIPLAKWTDTVLPACMLLELVLLSMALGERISRETQQRIQAQKEVIQLHAETQKVLEQKVNERTLELKEANARLKTLSITDGLTGIFNHRHFLDRAEHAIKLSQRYQRPIALIMMDIDHFKSVNDTHGHAAGDKVLKHVVATCCRINRETDIFGRLGGEEFGILLLETPAASAFEVAERLRR